MDQEAGKRSNYTGWLHQDLETADRQNTLPSITLKFSKNELKNMNKNELHV